jgi:hypothetical protein
MSNSINPADKGKPFVSKPGSTTATAGSGSGNAWKKQDHLNMGYSNLPPPGCKTETVGPKKFSAATPSPVTTPKPGAAQSVPSPTYSKGPGKDTHVDIEKTLLEHRSGLSPNSTLSSPLDTIGGSATFVPEQSMITKEYGDKKRDGIGSLTDRKVLS